MELKCHLTLLVPILFGILVVAAPDPQAGTVPVLKSIERMESMREKGIQQEQLMRQQIEHRLETSDFARKWFGKHLHSDGPSNSEKDVVLDSTAPSARTPEEHGRVFDLSAMKIRGFHKPTNVQQGFP